MLFEYLERCGGEEEIERERKQCQVPGCLRQRHCLRNCTGRGEDIAKDLEKAVREYGQELY